MRYRIVTGDGYCGCIPITVYWVQVLTHTWSGYKWKNIKGFDDAERAMKLLRVLRGEE